MHSLVAVVVILISFVVFTDPALAKKVSIGGTHSRGEIKGKCAAIEGSSIQTPREAIAAQMWARAQLIATRRANAPAGCLAGKSPTEG